MVVPRHPFERGQLDGLLGFPRRAAVDQFGLVQPIDGLSQRVVVTIALAAYRRLNAGFGQAFAVNESRCIDRGPSKRTNARIRGEVNLIPARPVPAYPTDPSDIVGCLKVAYSETIHGRVPKLSAKR
jgi:hypothetical protein